MAKPEIKKLATGVILFLGTVFHAGFYMACDFGLYWLLSMVREHGELVTQEQGYILINNNVFLMTLGGFVTTFLKYLS